MCDDEKVEVVDQDELQAKDEANTEWVNAWLKACGLMKTNG